MQDRQRNDKAIEAINEKARVRAGRQTGSLGSK